MADPITMNLEISTNPQGLLSLEAIQKILNRSRASVYRYANTDPDVLNPVYDPRKLNPEHRVSKDDPLMFHPNEVVRFAGDILGIKPITIAIQQTPPTASQDLLQAILTELQSIHQLLQSRP
jgi:cobalamin biosynthesis protein CbiD